MELVQRIREALGTVHDPELPVSIVDMGLVYAVEATPAGDVRIDLTFTAMGCPAMGLLRDDVVAATRAVAGVRSVDVRTVWDPPWTVARLSERARAALTCAGVGI